MTTQAFSLCELAIAVGLLLAGVLVRARRPGAGPLAVLRRRAQRHVAVVAAAAYAAAVLFLEPFYVASGFAQYLNRRAELEAWDIEQEFRRAFTR